MGNKPKSGGAGTGGNYPKSPSATPPTNNTTGGGNGANNKGNQNQGDAVNPSQDAITKYTLWLTVFTGLLFVTSIVSDIFIFKQWRVSAEQTANNREQLRAFIGQPNVATLGHPGPDGKTIDAYAVIIQYLNTGGTRTSKFQAWQSVKYFSGGAPNNMDFSQPLDKIEPVSLVVGPNMPATSPGFFIPLETIKSISSHQGIEVAWGHAEWSDVFSPGTIHHINFCFILDVNQNSPPELNGGAVNLTTSPYRADCNHSD